MPELPEIENVRLDLASLIKGKVIKRVIIRNFRLRWSIDRDLSKILAFQCIKSIVRRGKYLIVNCNAGSLLLHLGMLGSLTLIPKEKPIDKHDHVDICFMDHSRLRFRDPRRFGCVLWTTKNPLKHPLLINLGIEPLTKEFDENYLLAKSRNRKTAIKLFLMDNKVVVGIGTFMLTSFYLRLKGTSKNSILSDKLCKNFLKILIYYL